MILDQPEEVLYLIFEQLDSVRTLCKIVLVCKRFSTLCTSDLVWGRLVNNQYSFDCKGIQAKKLGKLIGSLHVYTWGENDCYQLGLPVKEPVPQPVPSSVPALAGVGVKSVSCGEKFTVSLLFNGTVWVCGGEDGKDSKNCLGLGSRHDRAREPTLVRSLTTRRIVQISAGNNHVAVCDSDGRAYTWGVNTSGCLGLNTDVSCTAQPKIVHKFEEEKEKVVRVACGARHTVFVTANKKAYGTGYGVTGCLGHGKYEIVSRPVKMDTEFEIEKVACGYDQTVMITNTGGLVGCGDICCRVEPLPALNMLNINVELPCVPMRMICEDFPEANFVQVSVGKGCGAAVTEEGYLYSWVQDDRLRLFSTNAKFVCCGKRSMALIDKKGNIETYGSLEKKSDFARLITTPDYRFMTKTSDAKLTALKKKYFGRIKKGDIVLLQPNNHLLGNIKKLCEHPNPDIRRELLGSCSSAVWLHAKLWQPLKIIEKDKDDKREGKKDGKGKEKKKEPNGESKYKDKEGPGHFPNEFLLPYRTVVHFSYGKYIPSIHNFENMNMLDAHYRLPKGAGARFMSIGPGHIAVIVVKN